MLFDKIDFFAPTNPVFIKESEGNFIEKKVYFDGLVIEPDKTKDTSAAELDKSKAVHQATHAASAAASAAKVRIYARLISKNNLLSIEAKPVIVVLAPIGLSIDDIDPQAMLDLFGDYAILLVDYFGEQNKKAFYTIYPKNVNPFWLSDPSAVYTPTQELKNSPLFYFSICAARAVVFLKHNARRLNIDQNKIGMVGIKEGAGLVFKSSLVGGICAAATFFNGDLVGEQSEMTAYKAALDSCVFAPKTDFPVLINAASNQAGQGLEYLNKLHLGAKNSALSIFAPSSKATSKEQRQTLKKWFDYFFNSDGQKGGRTASQDRQERQDKKGKELGADKHSFLYAQAKQKLTDKSETSATPFCGSHHLFLSKPKLEILDDGDVYCAKLEGDYEDVAFFVAQDRQNKESQNWRFLEHEQVGAGRYLASIKDCFIDISVFACFKTKEGFYLSTAVEHVPKKAGAVPPILDRKVCQNGTGEGWIVSGDFFGANYPKILQGALGLFGIFGDELATNAIGDVQFRGKGDAAIQLTLHSPHFQEIEIEATAEGDVLSKYTAKKTLVSKEGWTNLVLYQNDFKGSGNPFAFDKMVGIKIKGKDVFINSIIWL